MVAVVARCGIRWLIRIPLLHTIDHPSAKASRLFKLFHWSAIVVWWWHAGVDNSTLLTRAVLERSTTGVAVVYLCLWCVGVLHLQVVQQRSGLAASQAIKYECFVDYKPNTANERDPECRQAPTSPSQNYCRRTRRRHDGIRLVLRCLNTGCRANGNRNGIACEYCVEREKAILLRLGPGRCDDAKVVGSRAHINISTPRNLRSRFPQSAGGTPSGGLSPANAGREVL